MKHATEMSDDELLAFADEHLFYEVEMMRESWRALGDTPDAPHGPRWAMRMALIEVAALHGRVLINFLYPTGAERPDDVTSLHYVRAAATWEAVRPSISTKLEAHRTRANKEVAHLTTARVAGTPPEKEWTGESLREVERALAAFADVASPSRLSAQLKRSLILGQR